MRTMFIDTLLEIADADDRIFLLCGDLGYSVLEPFFRTVSQQVYQCGGCRAEYDRYCSRAGAGRLCRVLLFYCKFSDVALSGADQE